MKKTGKKLAALLAALAVSLTASAPVLAAEDGWVQEGGGWRCYQSGKPAVGWLQDGTDWYYLGENGFMATGWKQIDGSWYYLKPSGAMATGWLQLGDAWYYFKPSGVMVTGTQAIDGRSYTFSVGGVWSGGSTAVGGGLQGLLNSAVLNPQATASGRLNKLVREFISANLSDSMDTYTKVKTVFDYMVDNYSYETGSMDLNDMELLMMVFGGAYNEAAAISILETGRGVCDHYSAAFAAILQAIGLDCRVVNGIAYTTSGSGSGHAWTVVNIGGVEYIFDPQIEQNIAMRDGVNHYYRFGKTYASIPGRYDVYGYSDFLR